MRRAGCDPWQVFIVDCDESQVKALLEDTKQYAAYFKAEKLVPAARDLMEKVRTMQAALSPALIHVHEILDSAAGHMGTVLPAAGDAAGVTDAGPLPNEIAATLLDTARSWIRGDVAERLSALSFGGCNGLAATLAALFLGMDRVFSAIAAAHSWSTFFSAVATFRRRFTSIAAPGSVLAAFIRDVLTRAIVFCLFHVFRAAFAQIRSKLVRTVRRICRKAAA